MNFSKIAPKISVSIVSHHQAALVRNLLTDINRFCKNFSLEIILTLNLPETQNLGISELPFSVLMHSNVSPKGFGENHNQAFRLASGDYFCVMNPDIRLNSNPFEALLASSVDSSIGMVAPVVLGVDGAPEDSARHFPTFTKILKKVFTKSWTSDYVLQDKPIDVDWAAGMFMLFPRSIFERVKGFNERYFLYYEDVDICARLHLAGLRVVICPESRVIHHAQHSSHRSLRYLRWHLTSLIRFLTSTEYRQLKRLHRL